MGCTRLRPASGIPIKECARLRKKHSRALTCANDVHTDVGRGYVCKTCDCEAVKAYVGVHVLQLRDEPLSPGACEHDVGVVFALETPIEAAGAPASDERVDVDDLYPVMGARYRVAWYSEEAAVDQLLVPTFEFAADASVSTFTAEELERLDVNFQLAAAVSKRVYDLTTALMRGERLAMIEKSKEMGARHSRELAQLRAAYDQAVLETLSRAAEAARRAAAIRSQISAQTSQQSGSCLPLFSSHLPRLSQLRQLPQLPRFGSPPLSASGLYFGLPSLAHAAPYSGLQSSLATPGLHSLPGGQPQTMPSGGSCRPHGLLVYNASAVQLGRNWAAAGLLPSLSHVATQTQLRGLQCFCALQLHLCLLQHCAWQEALQDHVRLPVLGRRPELLRLHVRR